MRPEVNVSSVMPHKYVTKVVWYILVQLSSLNITMSKVSGVSVQVSGRYGAHVEGSRIEDKGQTVPASSHLLSDT